MIEELRDEAATYLPLLYLMAALLENIFYRLIRSRNAVPGRSESQRPVGGVFITHID